MTMSPFTSMESATISSPSGEMVSRGSVTSTASTSMESLEPSGVSPAALAAALTLASWLALCLADREARLETASMASSSWMSSNSEAMATASS